MQVFRALKQSLLILLIFFGLVKSAEAVTIAKQTDNYSDILPVWQTIQELGDTLNGTAGTFTFRVSTAYPNSYQFAMTAYNSNLIDKTTNTLAATPCIPPGQTDIFRGLSFNTQGVPPGYEDVTFDFSCRNYQFISGHKYLIQIANSNICGGCIQFAAVHYGAGGPQTDSFSGGGLRFGHGNTYDYFHHYGVCEPYLYIWQDPTVNPASGCNIWTSPGDDLYFILTNTSPDPTPTPTPSPTPSPTSTPSPTPTLAPTPTPVPGPAPFLDLPWDYEGKGLSFNDAANAINSYFDHEYPLLSSGLSEPQDTSGSIIKFDNPNRSGDFYTSHDGYDYGKLAKVNLGDPVLAAAAGVATYVNSCSACGNMVVIDHGNAYQTRYLHLQKTGLITSIPGQKVSVSDRQPIGKVGATGNVSPAGDAGAHIHFGVFQDKNNDGNFEDNVPDGVTDPFGWQSKTADPWPAYVFDYAGQKRTGNVSYYLWKQKLENLDATLTANGAVFNTGHYNFNFPPGSTASDLKISLQSSPIVKASNKLQSIGASITATATDTLGNLINQFQNLFKLTIDFGSADLTPYNTSTISIYSSQDGLNWTKENTTVNLQTKNASAQLNHFTHFALMAERRDTIPPTTTASLGGTSEIQISLNAQDNPGGLGVDYTLYSLDGGDWDTYVSPLNVTADGHHKIQFYSADKDENLETVKSSEFDINTTSNQNSSSTIGPSVSPSNSPTAVASSGNNSNIDPTILGITKTDTGSHDQKRDIIGIAAENMAKNEAKTQANKIPLILAVMGILILGVLFYYKLHFAQFNSKNPNNISIAGTEQTKIFTYKNLKFSVNLPSNFKTSEKFTTVIIDNSSGQITISRNGTNFDNLEDYLNDLGTKNKLEIHNESSLLINGLKSKRGDVNFPGGPKDGQMTYYILADSVVYSISTSSPSLYSDLDKIAQSFRYTP